MAACRIPIRMLLFNSKFCAHKQSWEPGAATPGIFLFTDLIYSFLYKTPDKIQTKSRQKFQ